MKGKLTLSKSQYIKGLRCPLSLWFYRAAANANQSGQAAEPEINEPRDATRQMGDKVGALARDYFPGGVKLASSWRETEQAETETQRHIDNGETIIYEATAINPADGTYCSIDILKKVAGTDEWDMVEVKSGTRVKDEYLDDIAFQRHVFEGAGYKVRKSLLLHIDTGYVRNGAIDVQKLFRLRDVTDKVVARQPAVAPKIAELLETAGKPQPPGEEGRKCSPYNCETKDRCWQGLPLYSIFNAYTGKEAPGIIAQVGSHDVNDIPENLLPGYKPKRVEVEAHRSGKPHLNQSALGRFLKTVEYPVYYLDYETVMSAIPLYDATRPFQQVPFQFSLHVQEEEGGPLTHISFLHKEVTDPRRAFVEALVNTCGEQGSVIVYYKDFEAGRNTELAADFPEYADQLKAINARMVDMLEPFRQRWLYHPDQNGSVSLKTVLPVYTGLSYDNMAIGNGEQAYLEYLAFVTGAKADAAEIRALWDGLEEYCAQDTYAMVVLLKELYRLQKEGLPPPALLPARGP